MNGKGSADNEEGKQEKDENGKELSTIDRIKQMKSNMLQKKE